MARSMFISIDGIDGAGKTSQVGALHRRMNREIGLTYAISEPGGSPFTKKIRRLLMDSPTENHLVDLLLINAARAYHHAQLIEPLQERGVHIITDRYVHSSLVYQGLELGEDVVANLHYISANGFMPDLTFIIDVPVEVAMERLRERGNKNRFDSATAEQMEARRAAFLAMENTVIVNGNDTFTYISQVIWDCVMELKNER